MVEEGPAALGQQLRLWSRDEHVPVHRDFQTAERGGTDDMLQRFALAAAPDEFAKAVNLRRREHPLKREVQPHARLLEQVRQQQFRL